METISFGTPTGSARIAGATSAVPPEPPAEITPGDAAPAGAIQRAKASAIAATAAPRSPVNTPGRAARMDKRDLLRGDVGAGMLAAGREIDQPHPQARRRIRSRMKRSSSPLVSSVPATRTTGSPDAPRSGRTVALCAHRGLARGALVDGARRGLDRATGTGCDQRVGSTGLEM